MNEKTSLDQSLHDLLGAVYNQNGSKLPNGVKTQSLVIMVTAIVTKSVIAILKHKMGNDMICGSSTKRLMSKL